MHLQFCIEEKMWKISQLLLNLSQKPFVLKIRLNFADEAILWIFIQAHFWCDLWLPATVGDRHLLESAEEVEEEEAPKEIDR